MKKAVIFLAPAFEETEAVTIIDILRRAEIHVTVAGIVQGVITGSHNIPVNPDTYIDNIKDETFDMVILPGGTGTKYLREDNRVLEIVQKHHKAGKFVTAICAAPTVLLKAGILKGKKVTSFPAEKAKFIDCHYLEEKVVQDGKIITSRAVGTAILFSLKLVENLINKEKAEEVAKRILADF